jgi:MSHA biogenesis protein MshO
MNRNAGMARGFTLIEMVMVIVIIGIIAAMVAVFIRRPIDAYVDQARRAELTDAADTALRRIARDVQGALPNSVRVGGGGNYLEFLPISAAGRYRAAPDIAGAGNFLNLTSTANPALLDVLGPAVVVNPPPVTGDQLVIYNLGLSPSADAYVVTSNNNRRLINSSGSVNTIAYASSGIPFPFGSPNSRFHVVNKPVTYVCVAGTLRRYTGYAITTIQPIDTAAAPLLALGAGTLLNTLLTGSVGGCSFTYTAAASQRNGLLTMQLTLTSGGESISLLHQVHVDNSP